MTRHVIEVEVHENSRAVRASWKNVNPKDSSYAGRYRAEARSGATVYRAGGAQPLVAATRAVHALLAAYYRD